MTGELNGTWKEIAAQFIANVFSHRMIWFLLGMVGIAIIFVIVDAAALGGCVRFSAFESSGCDRSAPTGEQKSGAVSKRMEANESDGNDGAVSDSNTEYVYNATELTIKKIKSDMRILENKNSVLLQRITELETRPSLTSSKELVKESVKNDAMGGFHGLTKSDVLKLISIQLEPLKPFVTAKGAIMAFDRSEDHDGGEAAGACPVGWSIFRSAGGRMIIGAGQHKNRGVSSYPAFSDNQNKAVGGEEEVSLNKEQLPLHSHKLAYISISAPNLKYAKGDTKTYKNIPYFDPWGSNEEKITEEGNGVIAYGPGEAHNNMPPYIALYYCKKD